MSSRNMSARRSWTKRRSRKRRWRQRKGDGDQESRQAWKEKQVKRNEMNTMVFQKGDIKNNGPKNKWDHEKRVSGKKKWRDFFGWNRKKTKDRGEKKRDGQNKRDGQKRDQEKKRKRKQKIGRYWKQKR